MEEMIEKSSSLRLKYIQEWVCKDKSTSTVLRMSVKRKPRLAPHADLRWGGSHLPLNTFMTACCVPLFTSSQIIQILRLLSVGILTLSQTSHNVGGC
jgi:hypothetical protein